MAEFTEADFVIGSLVQFADASATIDVVRAPHLLRYKAVGSTEPREVLGRIRDGAVAGDQPGTYEVRHVLWFQPSGVGAGGRLTVDAAAVVDLVDRPPVMAEGRINGAAVQEPDRWLVPVWAERDGGREATTVYVDSANIVSIVHPGDERERPVPSMRAAPRASTEPPPFTENELAVFTLALLAAVRSQNFRRELDPHDIDFVEVQVEASTARPAVLVRLTDDRGFRLIIDPVPTR